MCGGNCRINEVNVGKGFEDWLIRHTPRTELCKSFPRLRAGLSSEAIITLYLRTRSSKLEYPRKMNRQPWTAPAEAGAVMQKPLRGKREHRTAESCSLDVCLLVNVVAHLQQANPKEFHNLCRTFDEILEDPVGYPSGVRNPLLMHAHVKGTDNVVLFQAQIQVPYCFGAIYYGSPSFLCRLGLEEDQRERIAFVGLEADQTRQQPALSPSQPALPYYSAVPPTAVKRPSKTALANSAVEARPLPMRVLSTLGTTVDYLDGLQSWLASVLSDPGERGALSMPSRVLALPMPSQPGPATAPIQSRSEGALYNQSIAQNVTLNPTQKIVEKQVQFKPW